jgi:hypothetical protein
VTVTGPSDGLIKSGDSVDPPFAMFWIFSHLFGKLKVVNHSLYRIVLVFVPTSGLTCLIQARTIKTLALSHSFVYIIMIK